MNNKSKEEAIKKAKEKIDSNRSFGEEIVKEEAAKIEEVIKVTDEKILEISNYIHNADISATAKAKRRLELSMTLFMASIAMNSEEIAKENLAFHLLLMFNAAKETIEANFHGGEPNGIKITKMNEYEERNDEYRGI